MDNAIASYITILIKKRTLNLLWTSCNVCAISLFILIQKNLIYSNVAMIYSYLPKKKVTVDRIISNNKVKLYIFNNVKNKRKWKVIGDKIVIFLPPILERHICGPR